MRGDFNVMYVNFSRDSKSAAFAGAQPRAHPPFGVRALPKYAAKRRTETDNRREAAAEGRERGSDISFISAKAVERGSERRLVREHTCVAVAR